jgi:hypothetical protein
MAEKIDWRALTEAAGIEIHPILDRLQPLLDDIVNDKQLTPEHVIAGLTLTQAKPPEKFPVLTSSQMGIVAGHAKNILLESGLTPHSREYVEKRGPAINALLEVTDNLGGMGPGEYGDVLDGWGWFTHTPRAVANNLELADDVRTYVPQALELIKAR